MFNASIENVIDSGVCVGCGACAVVDSAVTMSRDEFGAMQADISSVPVDALKHLSSVCPFSDEAANEDAISDELFSGLEKFDRRVGKYLNIQAGRVVNGEDVVRSSSGGLTSWLCIELLRNGLVDGVIHVGPSDAGDEIFKYCVSTSVAEIRGRRKSQYYSLSFDEALKSVIGDKKKYAFVGVPCFAKAIRLLCKSDTDLRTKFPFVISLVCGHMKSAAFAQLLAWQTGVAPSDLRAVDFRVKVPDKAVHEYAFSAIGADGIPHTRQSSSLIGGLWGHATFQLNSCDYCDDIFGETADICFGDAWLGKYAKEWRGTNVVVTRSKVLQGLLDEGHESGSLLLDPLTVEELVESQAGNFRHRWDGLSVRLQDISRLGRWSPRKRIKPGSRPVDGKREAIVRLRQKMASTSHKSFLRAKNAGVMQHFIEDMTPLMVEMSHLTRPSTTSRMLKKIRAVIRMFTGFR